MSKVVSGVCHKREVVDTRCGSRAGAASTDGRQQILDINLQSRVVELMPADCGLRSDARKQARKHASPPRRGEKARQTPSRGLALEVSAL